MDNSFFLFFTAALTALAVQNAVFTRALGLNRRVLFLKSPKMGILYGGVFCWMVLVSSLLVALSNYLLLPQADLLPYLRAPAYLLGVVAVYLATYLLLRRFLPRLFEVVAPAMPITTFNTALFGVFYVSASQSYNFSQTVGYALGTGVGYTAAILIIYFARKRLAISPVSRSFRGLPILLLYIGLLSLAIYGLTGHGLPT